MTSTPIIAQVQKGMEVRSSDGTNLGKVTQIWIGTDTSSSTTRCDEALCSRVEVHRGLFGTHVLYIPYPAKLLMS